MGYTNLYEWGLSEQYVREALIHEHLHLARVTEQHRNLYKIISEDGFLQATVLGKFIYNTSDNADFPAVGDWVMIEAGNSPAIIHRILTRKSVFKRKAAGTAAESQVVASNIDTVFICMALNSDYNLRRLERYLAVAWDSGAVPVVVLTKSDLCDSLEQKLGEAAQLSFGADILVCSSFTENGYGTVMPYIKRGKTIAFIGSSGVGKSTLINHLLGAEALVTKEIGYDGRGRHATTHRQLILLPHGGLVIDTPGMRELGMVNADFETAFADIEELAANCKFSDCSHISEPGCAVRAAIDGGFFDAARFENYIKLQTEAGYSGLTSKQIDEEKIRRLFGGKSAMKQALSDIKKKNHR